jgi:PST family polysaccharide transporter
VTSANTLLVLVRMFFSLISQKILAIFIGAEGIALVGNLKNVIVFFEQFSILGTSNGLVKYYAQYKDDKQQLGSLFSTVFLFTFLASLIAFIVLMFWSHSLNNIVFGSEYQYDYIFKILALIIPFMGVNAILYSLLNGFSAYKLFSKLGVVSVICSTTLIAVLTIKYNVKGSLIALSVTPVLQFLIYMVGISKEYRSHLDLRKIDFKISFKNRLLSYTVMTLIVIFCLNISDIAIRHLIENRVSGADAGYWTAMNGVSKIYMQFTAAVFPLYILPMYSKFSSNYEFKREVIKIYKMLLPVLFIGMIGVFLLRQVIIRTLYTSEFLEMSVLFKWQLIGDFIRFIGLVISYQFIAKRQVSNYIFTELLYIALFYGFSLYLIDVYNTEGVVIAHTIRSIIYLLVVFYMLRGSLLGNKKVL